MALGKLTASGFFTLNSQVKVHLSGVKGAVLSGAFCLLSEVGTIGPVELGTVGLSTSHETTELSAFAGHE